MAVNSIEKDFIIVCLPLMDRDCRRLFLSNSKFYVAYLLIVSIDHSMPAGYIKDEILNFQ